MRETWNLKSDENIQGLIKRHESLGLRLMSPQQELNEQQNLTTKHTAMKLQNIKDAFKSNQRGKRKEQQSD